MLTVTQLAKKHQVSRTTILYYEKAGLLTPSYRSENGYRWYGDKESQILDSIIAYRSFGVPINDIAPLLTSKDEKTQESILQEQFQSLEQEVQRLRQQQKAIVMLLGQPELAKHTSVTKERWVQIMRSSGMNEEDMANWHKQFERMEPDAHQEFLESLGIASNEIKQIRGLD
ncbi:MerR family transcriptional regulator [Vibrio kagoshimensis]|uniref:MerR family transcriptional regulator n=1 Tax=Vibrio kagoshimensis TaxID=2910244 RepID=UPI003D208009